jgi:hypothetical protein
MNRISIRGVGIAAAALVATSLTVGSSTSAADAQETGTLVPQASSLSLDILTTNSNTDIAFPGRVAGISPFETGSAELALVHETRARAIAASSVARAQALAAAKAAIAHRAATAAANRAAREGAEAEASRSLVRPVLSGSLRALGQNMAVAKGWTGSQWECLDNIWMRESGWSTDAANPSGAYGIPQASPGSKMASAGADWRTNPATQISWGLSYIASAYGSPCQAWSFWQSHFWY